MWVYLHNVCFSHDVLQWEPRKIFFSQYLKNQSMTRCSDKVYYCKNRPMQLKTSWQSYHTGKERKSIGIGIATTMCTFVRLLTRHAASLYEANYILTSIFYYPLSVKRTVYKYLLLFHKIQLSRHDSVDEIVVFDIWAEPTAIGICGMSNIFSAAICVMVC